MLFFKTQGELIEKYASKNVKVCVVGNPANTNCFIAAKFAPSIPAKQWSALTRLDQNRAQSEIAQRCKVHAGDVKNVIIWGNHSTTQYPECSRAEVTVDGKTVPVKDLVEKSILESDFIRIIQNRGAAVINQRGSSSAQSASRAIVCHMRDWALGTKPGEYASMAVLSDGSYGVPKGLVFSFPVTITNGEYSIVQDFKIDNFAKEKLALTTKELLEEQEHVLTLLNQQTSKI